MAQTSLGREVMKLRQRKGISQEKLIESINWASASPLIGIEQNKRVPSAETISKIVAGTGGTFADECRLLGHAGHLNNMPIPSLSQIKQAFEPICQQIRTERYPFYITDFRGVYWIGNPATAHFFRSVDTDEAIKSVMAQRKIVFDLIFDSRWSIQPILANAPHVYLEQVRYYKATNIYRQHHSFFQAYPEIMSERLLPQNYMTFRRVWDTTEADSLRKATDALSYFSVIVNDQPIEFQLLSGYAGWLGGFCDLTCCVPRNTPENLARAELLFPSMYDTSEQCVTFWDVNGDQQTEQMLEDYRTEGRLIKDRSKRAKK